MNSEFCQKFKKALMGVIAVRKVADLSQEQSSKKENTHLKVLTLNTHAWMEEHPEEKLEQLADTLAAEEYAVIALQEINQSMQAEPVEDDAFISPKETHFPVRIKADNFAYMLVSKLRERGINYYWSWSASHIGYSKYDEGIAILSEFPFTAESHLVSDTVEYTNHFTRKILKGLIEYKGRQVTVISSHYSWWTDDSGNKLFQPEWSRTLDNITKEERQTILVMGDFNNDPSIAKEGYEQVVQTAPFLSDTFEVAEKTIGEATVMQAIDGWSGHSDDKRIDYIFVGENISVEQYRVVFDGRNEPVVSDHFGVEAHLNIKTY